MAFRFGGVRPNVDSLTHNAELASRLDPPSLVRTNTRCNRLKNVNV